MNRKIRNLMRKRAHALWKMNGLNTSEHQELVAIEKWLKAYKNRPPVAASAATATREAQLEALQHPATWCVVHRKHGSIEEVFIMTPLSDSEKSADEFIDLMGYPREGKHAWLPALLADIEAEQGHGWRGHGRPVP